MAERPSKDANRSEWDDYAKTLDIDPEEYSNKESLIEAVEAELLLRDDDEDDDTADAPADPGAGPADPEDDAPPTADAVEVPKEGDYPEGYENASAPWKTAFDHAVSHGNPTKTAIIYADQHCQDEEFGG